MKKLIRNVLNKLPFSEQRNLSTSDGVEYSVKKYRKAYELLEKHDKEAIRDPEALADPERLRPYLRALQKKTGVRRAHSAI